MALQRISLLVFMYCIEMWYMHCIYVYCPPYSINITAVRAESQISMQTNFFVPVENYVSYLIRL